MYSPHRTFTPSSGNMQYFNNSPSHESQMWSTGNALTTDDYNSPKGGLPAFQRLTQTSYRTTSRSHPYSYPSSHQVYYFSIFHSQVMLIFFIFFIVRLIHGRVNLSRAM